MHNRKREFGGLMTEPGHVTLVVQVGKQKEDRKNKKKKEKTRIYFLKKMEHR